jgi:hypothetical protein
MIGDRGMITSARITALKDDTALGWVTALRAPAIKKLAMRPRPLQMSLFDEQDSGRDHQPGLPRRAAHRLPQPVPGRRARPQAPGPAGATEAELAKVAAQVTAGKLRDPDKIGLRATV